MYWGQIAVVKTKNGVSSGFRIKRGVRQGCALSSNLLNLYREKIFREIEGMPDVGIGGVNMNTLRYVDDPELLATDYVRLQGLINTANEKGKEYGISINIKKTKVMVITRKQVTRNAKITIEGRAIEQVKKFIYLGHLITDSGKCDGKIKRRIELARGAIKSNLFLIEFIFRCAIIRLFLQVCLIFFNNILASTSSLTSSLHI